MTGFWQAAERVRSGAMGEAAPRPVSRFEGEAGALADFDFELVEPLTDDQATGTQAPAAGPATPSSEPRQAREPPPASEPIVMRETIEIRTEPAAASPASIPASPPTLDTTAVPSPQAAAPPAPDPTPPLFSSTTAEPAPSSRAPPAAAPILAEPPRPAPSERLVHETATERTTVIVEATPLAPAGYAAPAPPHGLDAATPSPSVDAPAFNIQIDRIEIRIDPPSPPAASVTTRRPAPPIELNDYLARRGG